MRQTSLRVGQLRLISQLVIHWVKVLSNVGVELSVKIGIAHFSMNFSEQDFSVLDDSNNFNDALAFRALDSTS